MFSNGEFEHKDPSLIVLGVSLNLNDLHVPEIECYIRTIKECSRSVYTSLPFKKFPNWLLVETVYAQSFWL